MSVCACVCGVRNGGHVSFWTEIWDIEIIEAQDFGLK